MINQDLEALRIVFWSGINSLRNFEFTVNNPVFWGVIFLLFVVLCRFWMAQRAFSFSFMTSLILLFTTEIEYRFVTAFSNAGEVFDAGIIRLIALIAIGIIFLIYAFLK